MSDTAQRPSPYLRLLRDRLGLSSRELAAEAKVSQNTILNAERGSKVPHPTTQLRIVAALDRGFRALTRELGQGDAPTLTRLDVWPRSVDEQIASTKVTTLLDSTSAALVSGEAVA